MLKCAEYCGVYMLNVQYVLSIYECPEIAMASVRFHAPESNRFCFMACRLISKSVSQPNKWRQKSKIIIIACQNGHMRHEHGVYFDIKSQRAIL